MIYSCEHDEAVVVYTISRGSFGCPLCVAEERIKELEGMLEAAEDELESRINESD